MTCDTDFCRVHFAGATRNLLCSALGVEWPPPERLAIGGMTYVQHNRSQLTDEQAEACTSIARGAEYFMEEDHGL